MKKLRGITLAVLLSASMLLLPACGGGGDGGGSHSMVGAWQLVTLNGAAPTADQLITMLFNPDGTGTSSVGGHTRTMTWSLVDNVLTTIERGHDPDVGTVSWLSSNRFQYSDASGKVMVFEKF